MSPATRASRASFTKRSARGSATLGASSGVGGGSGAGAGITAIGAGPAATAVGGAAAGTLTITGWDTAFSTTLTSWFCSKRVARAIAPIKICTIAIKASTQQATANTLSWLDFSVRNRLIPGQPANHHRDCQFAEIFLSVCKHQKIKHFSEKVLRRQDQVLIQRARAERHGFMMFSRLSLTIVSAWISLSALASAAGNGAAQGGHDHLPAHAEEIFHIGPFIVTNSMLMVWLVAAAIIFFAQMATKNLKLIPSGLQNFAEWLTESLYDFLEGILGKHLVKRTFWFFATIFVLILFSNWAGLIPGVGTVGWKLTGPGVDPHDTWRPLLRGANADLNMTAAMAFTFALLWFYWAITENGLKGFLAHIFAPKGKFSGIMAVFMLLVFLFVGVLEVVSILFRPVALSFRLYGNIFAGENILENMMFVVGDNKWLAWLPPIPFYFLELLVGLIQALVFTLLTSVFLKLICDHGDHHDEEEHSH